MRVAYVTKPPFARRADRVLRTATYLSVASLAPMGVLLPKGASEVYSIGSVVWFMLFVGSLMGAWATWSRKPQLEWVACYPIIGSLTSLLVRHLGGHGWDQYAAVTTAFTLFVGVRLNYLASLRARAVLLKRVINE